MPKMSAQFSITIDAPARRVFTFLLDPAHLFLGDPSIEVSQVHKVAGGVGTTARVRSHGLVMSEDVALEFVEVLPYRRIVTRSRPRIRIGLLRFDVAPPSFTWTVESSRPGATLTVEFVEEPNWLVYTVDTLTRPMWSRQIQGWMKAIKAAVEAPAVGRQKVSA